MRKEGCLNRTGEFFSKHVGSRLIEWQYKRFGVRMIGQENLHDLVLQDKAFLLAGTHVRPQLPFATSGMAPDGFITAKALRQETQRDVSGIINYGYDLPRQFKRFERPLERVSKGLVKGIGAIPVNHVSGRASVDLFRDLEKAIADKKIILVYPLGMYYDDFNPSQKIENGTAIIAKKYSLPIVVMYARNCNNWFKPNQDVDLVFDQYFSPQGLTVDEINTEIMQRFSKLQAMVKK